MKNNRVNFLLFSTILSLTVLPLIAAFYFLDHSLQTSLNLGFNSQILEALDSSSRNLKRLKLKDPDNALIYRKEFEQIENLKLVYSKPQLVREGILDSLKIYFGFGLIGALLVALSIAATLSHRIAKGYNTTFAELLKQKEQNRYLEEISAWQDLAKMLAHEIKNPLTPIQVLISSLSKAYKTKSAVAFDEQLMQTETMVLEELGHLKDIVNRFSEFSRIPKVQLSEVNLIDTLEPMINTLQVHCENVAIDLVLNQELAGSRVKMDPPLFRQVLLNIIQNGIEANPHQPPQFTLAISLQEAQFRLAISNNGIPVPKNLAERIFEPYVSNKIGKDNMGLGLAIVKKIIIEHGGDITYEEFNGHPTFSISLRRTA